MRKQLLTIIATGITTLAMAGGVVTNANQSASYVRMPAQDATLAPHAAYYNPAGLAFIADGFYVSINNQYIAQTREVTSTFPGMNLTKFEGDVNAPLFPGFYMVFKKEKVAFSLGINPIGGGGSAKFDNGLPSFEQQVAVLPSSLTAAGINTTAYEFNSQFEGNSLMWGLQANGSYAINDMISFSVGIRYVIAQNIYTGYMKDIRINPLHPLNPAGAGQMTPAPEFFNILSTSATTAANGLNPLISGGGGTLTLNDAVSASYLTPEQATQLAAGLGVADYTTYGATISQIQTAYLTNAATMAAYSAMTSDKEVDVEQNGSGLAPIIGINVKVNDRLNFGFRYEHRVSLNVKNKTKKDDAKLYPDGVKYPNDMPTTLSLGASYKATEKLGISAGVHYYFDKTADYGKIDSLDANGFPTFYENDEVIDNNFLEVALGFEYNLNDKILLSAGYLRTQTGVNIKFHSDLSHSLSSNTIGLGGRYAISDNIGINLGFMRTLYINKTKPFDNPVPYTETYKRVSNDIALGVDLKF